MIELSERSTKGGTGPTAIECGLIVAGISVTIIVGAHVFGSQLKTIYSRVASQLLPASAVDVTGTIGASEVSSSWDRQGITRIIVGQSETINARKYGTPVPTIMKANASISPGPIAPGQRNAVAAATATAAQGNRVKKLCGDKACEEVVIPGGDFAAESEGILSPGSPD